MLEPLRKLEVERQVGNLLGIKLVRGVKSMIHSQFAEDRILLGGTSTIMTLRFKRVLDVFINSLGGRVNHKKIKIYGWNISQHLLQSIPEILMFPHQET
jgi:hypothetical protein